MAENPISKLDELTTPASTDKLAIVNGGVTYKIKQDNLIPDATEAIKGKTELATDAETETGTDTTKVVTPANVASAYTKDSDTDVKANAWTIDENDMASNLDTKLPTQQSVKAYVDAEHPVKATGAEINTATDDAKFATPKAIKDSWLANSLLGIEYVSSFAANASQGIASDGTYIYTTSTTHLYKYTKAGALQTSRDISGDGTYDHIGDLCYHDGFLYVGTGSYPTTPLVGAVLKIDASDLSFDSEISTQSNHECSSVARDTDGNFWVTSYSDLNPNKIYKYNSAWTYQSVDNLETVDFDDEDGYDGIEWVNGYLLAMAHFGGTEGEFLDKYSFDGTTFKREQRIYSIVNGFNTGQGIALDPTEDGVLWMAAREDSNKAYKTNIIEEENVKKAVDDSSDGWKEVSETWAYASASTITVPLRLTTKYRKGDRIKIVQDGSVKYFALSGSATGVLTILVNTDYVLANAAITHVWYSHELNPVGFPDCFTCAAPIWENIDDGSGGQPAANKFFQKIIGNTLHGRIITGTAYKSVGAGNYAKFAPPVAFATLPNRTCIGSSLIRVGDDSDLIGVCQVFDAKVYPVVQSSMAENLELDSVSMDYSYKI